MQYGDLGLGDDLLFLYMGAYPLFQDNESSIENVNNSAYNDLQSFPRTVKQ